MIERIVVANADGARAIIGDTTGAEKWRIDGDAVFEVLAEYGHFVHPRLIGWVERDGGRVVALNLVRTFMNKL